MQYWTHYENDFVYSVKKSLLSQGVDTSNVPEMRFEVQRFRLRWCLLLVMFMCIYQGHFAFGKPSKMFMNMLQTWIEKIQTKINPFISKESWIPGSDETIEGESRSIIGLPYKCPRGYRWSRGKCRKPV